MSKRKPSWLSPMWRDIDSLRRKNESIRNETDRLRCEAEILRQENEILRQKADILCEENKASEERSKRLLAIDPLTMKAIFRESRLPESGLISTEMRRYDERIFRHRLLDNGLLHDDIDLLIDAYHRKGKGKIV